MKVGKEFFNHLKNIPKTAWTMERIEGKTYFILKNPSYCQVFWVTFWYHYFTNKFKTQKYITHIENLDLTLPVFITTEYELVNAQQIIENISYYSELKEYKPPMFLNIKMTTLLILYLVFVVFIVAGSLFYKKINPQYNINML